MQIDAPILVTGAHGMVGSAVVRRLQTTGCSKILTPTRKQLDLRDLSAVREWFATYRPRYVFHIAGRVGGILANSTYPADFLFDNLLIHATVLRAAQEYETEKLLYLGSSCVYPRDAPQPMHENHLMTGTLEPTNYGYAIAKLSGLMSCWAYRDQYGANFISAMPTNLYGPGDNFDPKSSHVIPGLIRRMDDHRQSETTSFPIWGDGSPRREFLFVEDLADALFFLMQHYNERETINVGSGEEVSIRQLVDRVRELIYPAAEIECDLTKPNGPPRKLLDTTRLRQLGWKPRHSLQEGLARTYQWYRSHL